MAGDDWCFFDGKEFCVRRAVEDFFTPREIEILVRSGQPNPEWEQWVADKQTARIASSSVSVPTG
jgi:hypothetical protein